MKTEERKRGISFIVLIITIIVVIILAAVVILTLSKNNPIESAKEARFKDDVRTFQDELALTVSKQYTTAGGHRDEKITTSDFDEIKEYIPSFNEKYKDKFIIQDDELVYTKQLDDIEKEYAKSLNINKKSLLPMGYQQVEYIESTGTQWIDTKYYPKPNTKIEISIYRKTPTTYSNPYGCGWHSTSQFTFEMYYNLQGNNCRWDRGSSENGTSPRLKENTNYIIIQDDKNCYVNDELVATINDNSNKTSIISLALFARNPSGNNPFLGRINYSKIWDNENIIRNFIPCYSTTTVTNVDGEMCEKGTAGLYDLVEGKFYTNKGDKTKGDFVCGPEV